MNASPYMTTPSSAGGWSGAYLYVCLSVWVSVCLYVGVWNKKHIYIREHRSHWRILMLIYICTFIRMYVRMALVVPLP